MIHGESVSSSKETGSNNNNKPKEEEKEEEEDDDDESKTRRVSKTRMSLTDARVRSVQTRDYVRGTDDFVVRSLTRF